MMRSCSLVTCTYRQHSFAKGSWWRLNCICIELALNFPLHTVSPSPSSLWEKIPRYKHTPSLSVILRNTIEHVCRYSDICTELVEVRHIHIASVHSMACRKALHLLYGPHLWRRHKMEKVEYWCMNMYNYAQSCIDLFRLKLARMSLMPLWCL